MATTEHKHPGDLIPDDLTMTTAERLRLVASIIEKFPDWHRQDVWVSDPDPDLPFGGLSASDYAGRGHCGTSFCAAGWAVACTAPGQLGSGFTWTALGAAALGVSDAAAGILFHEENEPGAVIRALRFLAEFPEGERTASALDDAGLVNLDELAPVLPSERTLR